MKVLNEKLHAGILRIEYTPAQYRTKDGSAIYKFRFG